MTGLGTRALTAGCGRVQPASVAAFPASMKIFEELFNFGAGLGGADAAAGEVLRRAMTCAMT